MVGFFKVCKHKYFECQLEFPAGGSSIFHLSLRIDRKCDHAGLHFVFVLLGLLVGIDLHDHRHWDRERNDWKTHDTEGAG